MMQQQHCQHRRSSSSAPTAAAAVGASDTAFCKSGCNPKNKNNSHPQLIKYRPSGFVGSNRNSPAVMKKMIPTHIHNNNNHLKSNDPVVLNRHTVSQHPKWRRGSHHHCHYHPHFRRGPQLWHFLCCAVSIGITAQLLAISWLLLTDDFSLPWENEYHWWGSSYTARNSRFLDMFDRQYMQHRKPIVLVGGTDGSGTRAFVDALRKLGVVIVSDDPETFDVHGQEMFRDKGWPALVNTVLSVTHSGNYSWDDLPPKVQHVLTHELYKFMQGINAKYHTEKDKLRLWRMKRLSHAPQYRKSPPPPTDADGVVFGMKAPVSMLVLPVLQQFLGRIKFIHVVRDGRDIALSDNQSPVLKFYNTTYTDYQNRSREYSGELYPVRGMQLWNDWNLQVQSWALHQKQPQQLDYEDDDNSTRRTQEPQFYPVEYLVMRSEDLLDPSTKYQVLQRLAEYVGSPLTEEEICCLAQEKARDFGTSVLHSEETFQKKNNNAKGAKNIKGQQQKKLVIPNLRHPFNERQRNAMDNEYNGLHQPENNNNNNNNNIMDLLEFLGSDRQLQQQTHEELLETILERLPDMKQLQQEEEKLQELESNLLKRQDALEKFDKSLQEREARLAQLVDSLKGLEPETEKNPIPNQKERKEESLNEDQGGVGATMDNQKQSRRRLLDLRQNTEEREPKTKLVPTFFVKQFHQWQEQALGHGKQLRLETLHKLIQFGHELESRWKQDSSAMEGYVDLKEILDTIEYLESIISMVSSSSTNSEHGIDALFETKSSDLHARYGKWKAKLENRTKLSNMLHEHGKEALREFGYEPRVNWNYPVDSTFQCSSNLSCSHRH